MGKDNEELSFNISFLKRTKEAREKLRWSQTFVADALGIPFERYKKYETRSPLPHYLIVKFCTLTGTDLQFFITGKYTKQDVLPARASKTMRV